MKNRRIEKKNDRKRKKRIIEKWRRRMTHEKNKSKIEGQIHLFFSCQKNDRKKNDFSNRKMDKKNDI